jgi:hypothetical protein
VKDTLSLGRQGFGCRHKGQKYQRGIAMGSILDALQKRRLAAMLLLASACLGAWLPGDAWADAYKCRTPEGGTVIQSMPCEGKNIPERRLASEAAQGAAAAQQVRENALALAAAREAFDRGDYQGAANTCSMRQAALEMAGGKFPELDGLCANARRLLLQQNLADQHAARELQAHQDAAEAAKAEAQKQQDENDSDGWRDYGWMGYGWPGYQLPGRPGARPPFRPGTRPPFRPGARPGAPVRPSPGRGRPGSHPSGAGGQLQPGF